MYKQRLTKRTSYFCESCKGTFVPHVQDVIRDLRKRGHRVELMRTWPNDVMVLGRVGGGLINATYDHRQQINSDVDGD